MAITFEEKSNLGKNIAILIVLVAVFFVIIFFGWRFLRENQAPASGTMPPVSGVNIQALQDPRLADLETFPKIAPAEFETGSRNPFVETPAVESASEPAVPEPESEPESESGENTNIIDF